MGGARTEVRAEQTSCRRRVGLFTFAMIVVTLTGIAPALAQKLESDDRPTIETLLKDGWQIAGYTSADDGWSAFILFRHPDQKHLVQCRAGYDVTREKRVQTNCYRLR
jgi:hypothetical protein